MWLWHIVYLFIQTSVCFLTSNTETAIEAYIPYYQLHIGKLEKKKRKTTTDLKNLLSAIRACINAAEQLAQGSYDITICNSKGKMSISDFSKGKETTIVFIRCSKALTREACQTLSACASWHADCGHIVHLSCQYTSLNQCLQICIAKASHCHDPRNTA